MGTRPGGNLKQEVQLSGRGGCGLWGPSGASPGGSLVQAKRTHECVGSQGPGTSWQTRRADEGARGRPRPHVPLLSSTFQLVTGLRVAAASSDLAAQIRRGWVPLGPTATEPKRHRPNSPSQSGGRTSYLRGTGRSPLRRPGGGLLLPRPAPSVAGVPRLVTSSPGLCPNYRAAVLRVCLSSSSLLVRTPIPGFRADPTPP